MLCFKNNYYILLLLYLVSSCVDSNNYYRSNPVHDSKNTFIQLDIISDQNAGVKELKDKIQFVKVYLYDENAGAIFHSYNLINPPIHNWFYNYRCYDENIYKIMLRHELFPTGTVDEYNHAFLEDYSYIFKIPSGRNKYKFEIYDRKFVQPAGISIANRVFEKEYNILPNQTLKVNLDFSDIEIKFYTKIENTNFSKACNPLDGISIKENEKKL
jgi:hypothetical protein